MESGADFEFIKHKVFMLYSVGEKTFFQLSFEGLTCNANIFKNPDLLTLSPPKKEMKEKGVDTAYIYSCPLSKRFPRITFNENYICYVDVLYRHYFVRVDRDYEQYLKGFRGKTISTLRRKVKKVATSCKNKPYFQVYSTPDEIEAFYETAKTISLKSYQHKLLDQGLPLTEQFKQKIIQQAREGKIQGFILFVEDKPAAYTAGPIYDEGVMLYDHTGYDPGYDEYSPGTVLQFKVIEAAFKNDKLAYYDLCTGEGKHKEMFTDDYKLCGNVYFLPLRPKYLFIVFTKVFIDSATGVFKKALDRLGLKEKLKRYFRRNA